MSIRAIILGLLLALAVASLGYPNTNVLGLTGLVDTQLPLLVCITLAVVAFLINPLLGWLRFPRPLTPAELAVIFALGAMSSAFPEGAFFRQASDKAALPTWHEQTNAAWRAQNVLSYVPGSVQLGAGHVHDWPAFAQRVVEQREEPGLAQVLWEQTPRGDRAAWRRAADPAQIDQGVIQMLVRRINAAIERGALHETDPAADPLDRARASRLALAEAFPELVEPPPRGRGVLLRDGLWSERTHAPLVGGGLHATYLSPGNVPWGEWAPVMLLWGGVALTMALASLCLAVIVHPQWAYREQLAYPIARVLSLMLQRDQQRSLPDVAYTKPFLITFTLVFAFHVANGVSVWLTDDVFMSLTFDFNPMRELFPYFSRPWQAHGVFSPTIYLAVIAFAFFLPRSVSFTFGIATPFFCLVSGLLIARGVSAQGGDDMEGSIYTSFTFGAFLALAGIIFYNGRRYYPLVARAAVGLTPSAEVSPAATIACRALIVSLAAAVALFWWGGLSVTLAILTVLLIMLLWLVVARIVCETGLYRIGTTFAPIAMLTVVFGQEALGPTTIIVIAMASILFTTDVTQTTMPYVLNGLRLTDEHTRRRTGLPGLMGMAILAGFSVAVISALTVQYQYGLNQRDTDVFEWRSAIPFDTVQRALLNSQLFDRTAETAWPSGALNWQLIQPDTTLLACIGLGVLAVVVTGMARLRIPGWPIHPVLFAVMGNWALVMLGFSFLLGWVVKSSVLAVGGARMYQSLQPVMVGIIAASLFSAAVWLVVGWTYYMATGQMPATYRAV